MVKNDFQYGGRNSYTLHPAVWHDHDIDFTKWLNPATWHVALESWQWIHQLAAPCNVMRGSGMTCHWIRPNVRHSWRSASGFDFWPHHCCRHVILHQSPKLYLNRTSDGRKNDVMSIFKMADLIVLGLFVFSNNIKNGISDIRDIKHRISLPLWRSAREQRTSIMQ